MTFDPVKPFEKFVDDDVVRETVSAFLPVTDVITWNVIEKGWQNVSVYVATSEEEVVLRFYSLEYLDSPRQKNDIIFGLEFMDYLYCNELAVPKILKTPGSEYVATAELGGDHHYVALLSYIKGTEINEYTSNQIVEISIFQAKMHEIAQHYRPVRSLSTSALFDLQSWFDSIKASLSREDQQRNVMTRLEKYIRTALEKTTPDILNSMPRIVIHGDLNRENFLFGDGKLRGVFDFDDCHESVGAEDMGVFLSDCLSGLGREEMAQRISCYFDTYHQLKRITPIERLSALYFCVEKWAITQYFFCANDILDGRPLDTPENADYIETTMQEVQQLLDIIQSVGDGPV